MEEKKPTIELQNISKSYYSETAVTQALRKVNLSFRIGEFVAITGESGSGKSTLLNIIGGMDSFDEGEMYINGEPTFQYDDLDWEDYRRTKIGYVFQDYSLIGHYSVLDNVMSALVIMGAEQETAKEMARKYLKQVGLEKYENHRATELSSGQKQRLSIARALAKNTDIIVADEPTGNLDSETGNQIVSLLKELSVDHLVIMVTHNYEQAEPYVTRKVRIHDGQVISDILVNEQNPEDFSKERETLPLQEMNRRWKNRVAALFARRNRKTQPGRAFLFTFFLFIISAASFLFIGELLAQKDDYHTRAYSKSTFAREDDTRISVKRSDGAPITDEDIRTFSSIRNVKQVDSCDLANDVNYYITENKDYEYHYALTSSSDGISEKVFFLDNSRFMKSADCISQDDLASGRLPEKRNEIVLYITEDWEQLMLDSTITCYFTAPNLWGEGQYYFTDLTVVGILKEETDQVYFSKDLCLMLTTPFLNANYTLYTEYESVLEIYKNKINVIPVLDESPINNALEDDDAIIPLAMETGPIFGHTIFIFQEIDERGNPKGDPDYDILHLSKGPGGRRMDYTTRFMEVSPEFYAKYCQKECVNYQASLYLTSYAKTDAVLKALEKKGYIGVSTYRISTGDYLEELVNQRLIIIGICAFGLIALLLAEVLILRSLMKIRVKDYFVLKFIGMKMQVIKKISYFEMGSYTLAAIVLTLILMWILRFSGVGVIQDIMWYYTLIPYLLFALYNFLLIFLTVASFNRILKGRLSQ